MKTYKDPRARGAEYNVIICSPDMRNAAVAIAAGDPPSIADTSPVDPYTPAIVIDPYLNDKTLVFMKYSRVFKHCKMLPKKKRRIRVMRRNKEQPYIPIGDMENVPAKFRLIKPSYRKKSEPITEKNLTKLLKKIKTTEHYGKKT